MDIPNSNAEETLGCKGIRPSPQEREGGDICLLIRFIREIDGMLPRVFRPQGATIRNIQVEPFGMLNVDCMGNVSTFLPELLGLKRSEYSDFILGNVHSDSLEDMRHSAALEILSRDIVAGIESRKRSCDIFRCAAAANGISCD